MIVLSRFEKAGNSPGGRTGKYLRHLKTLWVLSSLCPLWLRDLMTTSRTQRDSQLRDHFRGIPIRMNRLNLAVLIHSKHVDAFEVHFAAAAAGSLAGPLHSRAVASDENRIFS